MSPRWTERLTELLFRHENPRGHPLCLRSNAGFVKRLADGTPQAMVGGIQRLEPQQYLLALCKPTLFKHHGVMWVCAGQRSSKTSALMVEKWCAS